MSDTNDHIEVLRIHAQELRSGLNGLRPLEAAAQLRVAEAIDAALSARASAGEGSELVGVVRHARTHWDIRGDGAGNFEEYFVRFKGHPNLPRGTKLYTAAPQPAQGEGTQSIGGFDEYEAARTSQPAAAQAWPSSDPGYTTLFNAIAAATVNYAGFGVNVSVEKFREALAAATQPQKRDTGIDAAVERGDLRNTFDPPAHGDGEVRIGATRCYGDDAWFRELTVQGVTFLAPLDDQDRARHILARPTPEAEGRDAANAKRYLWLRDHASRAQLEIFRRGTRLAADRVCDAGIDIATMSARGEGENGTP